jgi:DNA topoisomerase-1
MSDATADTTLPTTDPLESARAIGLRYVNDVEPGLRRERDGATFLYRDAAGEPVTAPRVLARIESLRIPPAWEAVWICRRADGHLQATGRDTRGRKQYRYHPDWNATRNQTKYHRMGQFGAALPGLRERIDADLARRGLPRDKVLATVLRLMELTYIRIGNVEYARANSSYGLTTLRDKHVQVDGAAIRFQFVGKSGRNHAIDVKDRRLARIVKQRRDIPGYELFQYYDEAGERQRVSSGDVNDYLRAVTGAEFSAKDVRTWGGVRIGGGGAGGARSGRQRDGPRGTTSSRWSRMWPGRWATGRRRAASTTSIRRCWRRTHRARWPPTGPTTWPRPSPGRAPG